jgi:hypothetical protein
MESATSFSGVTEKIFKLELPNGAYPDGYIEGHPYYKAILNHVVKNCQWGKFYFSDKINGFDLPEVKAFDTAIKLIAMNFALWEQHSDLDFGRIEYKVEINLGNLRGNELELAYEYWVSDKKWICVGGEYYDYLITDDADEKLRVDTAIQSIKNAIKANFDLQVERLRSFLFYQTDRSFWYELLDSDDENSDIYINAILK